MFRKSTISTILEFSSLPSHHFGVSTVCLVITIFSILLASPASHGQTQASGITFRPVGGNNTSLRIDWTSGASTAGRIVIIKNASGIFTPSDGANISTLNASNNFTTATDLDGSAGGVAKAVYAAAGAGTTITVSNLVANTQYFVQVYEFTGTDASPIYLLTTNSTNPLGFVFFTSDGTFTVPIDITMATAQAWGAGGGGGEGPSGNSGPGGGGGAYAIGTAPVSFGVNPTITVGTGGAAGDDNDPGSPGGPSSFGTDVIALGGTQNNSSATGSAGGSGPGSTGNIDTFSGGAGGDGSATASRGGGGGGSSATTTGIGVDGSDHSGGSGGAGGDGDDGDGGEGGDSGSSNAQPGTFPGGGGGGRGDNGGTGGAGANGLVIVSFNDNTAPTASITRLNPAAAFTNNTTVVFRVTFNENVGNVDVTDFTISGTATATIGTFTANSEVEYDVEVNVTADGTLDLNFAGGQDIADISNNGFGGAPSVDETYTIDTVDPGFTAVTVSPNSGTAIINDIVTITLTANGAEQGLNPGTVEVNGVAQTLIDNADGTYTISYTVTSGHTDWGTGTLPISIEVTDDAGNSVVVAAFTDANTLAGDANEPTNENTVFTASIAASPGGAVTIVSSGDVNNEVWLASAGITSSTSLTGDGGATMTQATDGTSTTIVAPTTEGDYKLYVVDAAGNISSESTATLSVFTQPSSVEFASASNASDELEFSWTGGTGQNTVVLVKTTNAVSGSDYPLADGFNPTANTDFGSGTDLNGGATGTIKCVFESNTNGPVTISNLSGGTEYIIEVYEYTGSHIYLRPALSTTRFTANGTNPNTAATNMTFTSVTNNSITVQFTQGNGASSVLVARAGGSVGFTPEDGVSYTANTDYSAGADLGSGAKIIAFRTDAASGTPITVTGLSADVTYHFAVFEMNGTQGNGTENYSSVNLTGNRSTEPLTQASGLNFTSITETGMTLNWTAGDGDARLVIMRPGAAVATDPADNTAYTASNDFDFDVSPGGSAIGAGYVVYDGTSNNVSITNLLPGTTYHFAIYEYNTTTSVSAPNQVFLTPGAIASQATTSDVTPPAANTVGAVTPTGGRVVAGYYNATNTGLNVTVPLSSSDGSLDGGTIQIRVQNTANTGYVDVPNSGLYTILPADRSAGTVTIPIASADLEAAVSGLMGFSEGAADNASSVETKLLQITATVTDNSTNSTTYTESSTDLDVDQTSPTVVTSFNFYPDAGIQNGNREVIMFRLSEDLYNSSGSLVSDNTVLVNGVDKPYGGSGFSVDDPGASSNDVDANYVRYESDGGPNAEDNTIFNNRLIWVESNNNNSNWSNSASPVTKIQYVQFGTGSSAAELMRDAAGNELGTITETAVVSGDVIPPALSPDVMTLYPRSGNAEKIVFTLTEPLSTPTTANAVTGFSTSTGTIADATYSETSPGVCPCTITLTSSAHGAWTSTTLVSYDQITGNVLDLAGTPNELATISNHAVVVETTAPTITAVSIPNSTMKVGTVVPVTITTTDDDGDAPVFSGTFTIGGFTLSGLTYVNGTTKTAQFTVTEGGTNVAAGSNIPVNISLQDGQGNTSTAFTTAIVQGGDAIDANSPTITSITNSVNPVYEGALTQTVTVVYSETMNTAVQPVITLNGATANWGAQTASGGTNGWVGNTYTATFTHNATQETVSGMSTSVAVGGAQDAAGNPNLGNATSTSFNLDNQKPTATVTATTSTFISGSYAVNTATTVLTVQATFSEAMNPAVTPSVSFSIGTGSNNFTAGSGSWSAGNTVYTISYTHDATLQESLVNSVGVNGGRDVNGNNQTVAGTSNNFVIDTQRPTATTINRTAGQFTNDFDATYEVTFNEGVININESDFTPVDVNTLTSAGNVKIGSVSSGDNITFTLVVENIAGEGDHRLDINSGTATISDIYGNVLIASKTGDQIYTFDHTAPNATAIDISSPTELWRPELNGTSATSISFLVTFNDNVTGVDLGDFTVDAGTSWTYTPPIDVTGSGNTRTVTLNGVSRLNTGSGPAGQAKINLVNNGTILDNAGNALSSIPVTAYSGNDFYTILFPEPQDPAINPLIVNQSPFSISVQFDQPTAPVTPIHGYWVQKKKDIAGSFLPALADGVWDGGVTPYFYGSATGMQVAVGSLNSGFDYDFKVVSTSHSGLYSPGGDVLDYFLGSTLDFSSYTTTASSSTLSGSILSSTISSTVTASTGQAVIQFTVTDDGATPGADDAPFKFSTLTIKEGGTDLVADWSTVIAGARLVDSNGEFVDALPGSIGTNTITFTTPSTDPGPTPPDIGFIPDNTSKTYTLRIWLHPTQTDQTRLDFRVDDLSFIPDDSYDISQSSQRSSKFNGTPSVETGSIFVNVIATAFAFTTQPSPASTLVLTNFSTPPVAKAVDANGNVDTGYNGALFNVTVTNIGALPMLPGGTHPITITPSSGVVNFPAGFQYTAAGNGTLTVARGGINSNTGAGNVPCSPVTVNYSNLSTITGGTGVTRVLSTVTASPGTSVFSFTYNDDGGVGLGDGANTEISSIKVTPDGANELDWSVMLEGATLTDGTNTITASSIDATGITFSGAAFTTSALSTVVDGGVSASKTYTLNVWFKTDLGGLAETADQDHLVFSMSTDPSNLTLEATGSQAPAAAAETSGLANGIFEVDAARLVFTSDFSGALTMPPVPPAANSAIDFLVNTSTTAQSFSDPIVQAVDANGNRDTDYSSVVTVTPAAGMGLSNELASITNGTGTFSGSFEYDAIGNGTLTVSTATPNRVGANVSPTTNGQTVNVKTGTASTIDAASTVAAATISSITNDPTGEVVFTFRLDDDPAGTPPLQDDGTPTLVTGLVITGASANNTINDWREAIAGARLEDASDDSKFVDLIPADDIDASSLTFSSIPATSGALGYIDDDGTKTYNLKIWLKSDLTGIETYDRLIDGLEFGFDLLSANITTDPTGTSFLASQQANAANDATTVEVTATQIDFVTPDPALSPIAASLFVDFPVSLEARDKNGNLDLGFNSAITNVSNTSVAAMEGNGVTIGNAGSGIEFTVTSFSGGLFTFPPTFQFTTGNNDDNVTLSITAGGISSIPLASPPNPGPTTPYIELSSSFQSRIYATSGVQNIDYALAANQAIDIDLSSGDGYVIEQLVLADGDADGTTGDDDGAATVLNSLTLGITNPQSIRRIALYTNNGSWVEEDEQPGSNIAISGGYGQITFSGLSISADDNDALETNSKTVYVVVTFEDNPADIVDNSVIQINVVGAATGGGSKFRGETGDPLGGSFIGGIATTLAPAQPVDAGAIGAQNTIEVLATRLDFIESPLPIEGINQPLANEPEVRARDNNGVLDEDFNYTASISSSIAGISDNAIDFISGVLNFPGFQYTSAGVGTLTVTANALSSNSGGSAPCDPIDVIHTTATDIPAGSGGVLGTSNIKGGTIGAVVFGFTINPEHKTATHPSLNGFTITFDNAFKTSTFETFKNFKVFESTTGTFTGSTDVTALTGSVTIGASPSAGLGESDLVIVSFSTPRTLYQVGVVRSYFLVVDVDPTANISTPHLTPQLVDNGFGDATNNNIVTTQGSATASLVGQTYQFASTRPPQLLSSSPSNGQLNVDPDLGQIDLYFDVKVLTFDSKAELYDRNTNKLIAVLPALNGQFTGDIGTLSAQTVNPISFEIPDGVVLKPDSLYYLKIAQGAYDPISNQGTGISDEGQNFYGGISYNGTLYFKISSPNAPVMLATDPIKYFASNTAATFNATFDQFGTAYYLVLDDDAITTPTKAHIDAPPTYPEYATAYVAHGSFDIEQVSPNPQFASFTANLAPGEAYSVWIYAENDALPVRIETSAPYGGVAPFAPGSSGPTLQITVPALADLVNLNQPIIQVCPNSEALVTDMIIIGEENQGDFAVAGTQDFNILLPTGFSFDVDHAPSVTLSGSDFLTGATATFVNSTILNISFTNQGAGSLDNIIISDFKILATTTGAIATITRFAGNGLPTIPNTTVLATLYANPTALQEFTNTYTTLNDFTNVGLGSDVIVNVIPDNFNSPVSEVRLIPEITPTTDYGSSFFNGPGVTNDILNLTGVALNTSFDIAMTHTDLNGCVSEKTEQYLVYDHTAAIPIVGTEACITNVNFPNGDSPTLATPASPTLNYNAKAGFNLTALYAGIPDRVAAGSQVIYGSDWESLVNQIPVEQVGTAPVGYKNYKWDYSFVLNAVSESNGAITINPYNNDQFADTTINNNPYWRGGSLGLIEFIGIYRSTADLTVIVPFRQEIELFVPPIPVIEVSGQSAFAGSTPIFCEEQPDIVLNGFPLSTAGVSTGSFVLRDSASNAIIYDGITQITGFKDNGNGTANLTPKFVSNLNNTIRVEYTYQDNNSPCSGTGVAYIRIAPNPTAAFTYISNNTPNTPDGNGECERIPISFDASESEISKGDITYFKWNFNDALNSSGSNQNAPEGQVGEADMVEHTFNQSGAYGVSLIVTSNYGCLSSATTHPIDIGAIPDVAFSFRGVATNEPMTFSSQTLLESSPAIDDDLALLTWNFGDGSPTVSAGPSDQVLHTYVNPGKNTVTLSVTSDIGCVSDLSRLVVVVPKITFDDMKQSHLETFQADDGGYQFLAAQGSTSSWEHGVPGGTVINDPSNTNSVWTTGLGSAFNPQERSFLYTSSFNIQSLTRPIITFNSFVNVGTGDGIVLEYSTDDKNIADPDKVWETLGRIANSLPTGVGWYNGVSLPTKPGQKETGFGWTGLGTEWTESKHSLSDLTGADTVVFRFSFASGSSDPTVEGLDGFAIDDLRIGNGTRTVLLENFTNTGVSQDPLRSLVSSQNNAFRQFQESAVGVQVIKIDYHVGFPGEDPFNQANSMDPGARALYYNISDVPQARMDGESVPTIDVDAPLSDWAQQQFSERVLFLAEAQIKLDPPVLTPEGELSVTVSFTPNFDFAQPTLLHVAVLEETVTTTDNPGLENGRIATGETDFKYVLRKMLPNAAGTKYNTLTAEQATEPLTFTWSNANLFNPEDDIVVVAFLQDESTRRIYQAEIVRGVQDPSVVTGIEDLNASFNVYPNPADKELILTLPHVPTQSTMIQMFDQMGKVVNEGSFEAGQSTKTISTEDFAGGVYVIQVRSEKGILRRKVMVVHRN